MNDTKHSHTAEAIFIYSPDVEKYNFGPSHPFKSGRTTNAFKALQAWNYFTSASLTPPRKASPDELLLFHTKDHVEALKSGDKRNLLYYGIGTGDNPYFENLYEATLIVAGATLTAMESILTKTRIAFSFSGGLHHAHPRYASGFCLINDAAIAISKYLKEKTPSRQASIAYVDIDAHHGDGVIYGFYEEPRVLGISIHESGRYLFPGTGFVNERGKGDGEGFTINIPLPPGSDETIFIKAVDDIIMPALELSKPSLLVVQFGTDGYYEDPLTHLNYSPKCYWYFANCIKNYLENNDDAKVVVLGGGGYVPWFASITWAVATMIISGFENVEEVPEEVLHNIPNAPAHFNFKESLARPLSRAYLEEWENVYRACISNLELLKSKL